MDETADPSPELVARLDRIVNLMALNYVKDLDEKDESSGVAMFDTLAPGTSCLVPAMNDQHLLALLLLSPRALGLDPIEWSTAVKATKKPAPYIGEVLDQAFKDAVAVVVLLTPDDQARLKKAFLKSSDPAHESKLTGQARANVLFEAGMAFGRHPDSTILVEVGDLRPFSDVGGRHVVKLTDRPESRKELAIRLEVAGCEVNTDGDDWLSEGKFS